MKNIFCVLTLLALSVSFALAENAPRPINVAPATVDLVKFPVLKNGKLSPVLAYEMGLMPHFLDKPVVVMNHYRSDGSWRLQSLQKGDFVYVDKDEQLRYRADCSNRIEAVAPPCLSCHKAPTTAPARGMMHPTNGRGGNKTSSPDGFGRSFDNAWNAVTSVIGGVLGGILPLILAAAVLGLLWWLAGREVVRSHRATPPPPVTPPTPATPVTAPIAYSRAPVAQPASVVATAATHSATTPPAPPVVAPTTPSPATPPARSINFTEPADGKPFMIKTVGLRLVGYEEGEDGSTTIRIVRGK